MTTDFYNNFYKLKQNINFNRIILLVIITSAFILASCSSAKNEDNEDLDDDNDLKTPALSETFKAGLNTDQETAKNAGAFWYQDQDEVKFVPFESFNENPANNDFKGITAANTSVNLQGFDNSKTKAFSAYKIEDSIVKLSSVDDITTNVDGSARILSLARIDNVNVLYDLAYGYKAGDKENNLSLREYLLPSLNYQSIAYIKLTDENYISAHELATVNYSGDVIARLSYVKEANALLTNKIAKISNIGFTVSFDGTNNPLITSSLIQLPENFDPEVTNNITGVLFSMKSSEGVLTEIGQNITFKKGEEELIANNASGYRSTFVFGGPVANEVGGAIDIVLGDRTISLIDRLYLTFVAK